MLYTERVTTECLTYKGLQLNALHRKGYSLMLYTERVTAESFTQKGSQLNALHRKGHS